MNTIMKYGPVQIYEAVQRLQTAIQGQQLEQRDKTEQDIDI